MGYPRRSSRPVLENLKTGHGDFRARVIEEIATGASRREAPKRY